MSHQATTVAPDILDDAIVIGRRWPLGRTPATRNMDDFRWICEIELLNPPADRA
jgi:hypothetical protein